MLSGKSQSSQQPTAFGSLLQASTYGAATPIIYGMTQSPLLAIWAANLRQGGSIKKFKQLKKGITAYVENIDFLLGHNPILGVNQLWINGANIPLQFFTATTTTSSPFVTVSGGQWAINVPGPSGPPIADPYFYSVIGITVPIPYSITVDDYGGTGPQTITGTYNAPLWNVAHNGSDPNSSGALRYFPLTYRWEPSQGNIIYPVGSEFWDGGPSPTVYIARLTDATSYQSPLAHNRLAFEPQLGSGTEYADAGLSSQQIIYDMFSGIGSSDIDLGSSGALPSITAEVQAKFGTYPTGDCDFADMIEDIVKSGIAQASIGSTDGSAAAVTAVEHGLSCYNLPGVIQVATDGGVEAFTVAPVAYPMNVTEGNFLVAVGVSDNPNTISDTLGNTWTPVMSPSLGYQVWWAQANATGATTVTISSLSYNWQITVLEIAGVDTFDSASAGIIGESITTTNAEGFPAYLLNVNMYTSSFNPVDPQIPQWSPVVSNNNFYFPFPASASSALNTYSASGKMLLLDRRVYAPGTYSIAQNADVNPLPNGSCLLAFKCVNPPSYPRPVGNFMDPCSLNLTRQQCRANGLYGSLTMTAQKAASDWLNDLYSAADSASIFIGFQLYSEPYSEVSAVGGGTIYLAPTASGPTYNLTTENGDFVADNQDPPIKVSTVARVDQPNVLQMQCINRTSNYNPSTVEQPDAVSISFFGVRKADPVTNNAVQDVSIARQLLGIQVRKLQYGGDTYTFTLPARYCLFAPMGSGGGGYQDAVITISDPLASMFNIPVRITSMQEQTDQSLQCSAEPFIYGMYAPTPFSATTPNPYQGNPNQPVTGSGINPPIIFEATPALAGQSSPAQIWIVTSCSSPNYGGCVPYISTDGGLSYQVVGETPIMGSAAQGVVVGSTWPAANDPDTTNNLTVNLTESLQPLADYSATQRDRFQVPVYVGYSAVSGVNANFTVGDPSQITKLGVLFSNPVLNSVLPSDASVVGIYPVIVAGTSPADASATTGAYSGTGLTPTSGGTSFLSRTGVVAPPVESYNSTSIGSSLSDLTSAEIRYELDLSTSGGAATHGTVAGCGWAIYYSSATPYVDSTLTPPFNDPPPSGFGWAWAMPNTTTTGMVGTGTNASVTANGGVPPAGIGYELITYDSAILIGPNEYQIEAQSPGPLAVVQSGGNGTNSAVTTISVTLSGTTAGNRILVSVICGVSPQTITDSEGNVYELLVSNVDELYQSCFLSAAVSGGSLTITATVSAAGAMWIGAVEVSGIVDTFATSYSAAGTSEATISAPEGALAFSCGAADDSMLVVGTWDNDSGWTSSLISTGIASGNIAYQFVGAGASTNTPAPVPAPSGAPPQSVMVAFVGGGTSNEIRRGVFGAPQPGIGMAHPIGSPFGVLNPNGQGLVKLDMAPAWIGTPLFFKFPNFNTFGAAIQDLADADVYTYTPTGIAGNIGPSTGLLVGGV